MIKTGIKPGALPTAAILPILLTL